LALDAELVRNYQKQNNRNTDFKISEISEDEDA
jgi:hypothetical protein